MEKDSKILIEQALEDHKCFVLLTCSSPSKKGKMKADINHKGDLYLTALLLEQAQNYIDEQIAIEEEKTLNVY